MTTIRKFHIGTDFLNKLVQGLIIGIAGITPGLSGGAIAAATGLYEPAIHAIVNIKKEFSKSARYLLPLAIGGAAGFLLFSRLMENLMVIAEFPVIYAFIGFVVGSVPALVKEANNKGFRAKYILPMILAFLFTVSIGLIPVNSGQQSLSEITLSLNFILSGSILAIGTLVPGIAASFILMHLGIYESMIIAIAEVQIVNILLIGTGFLATALAIIKLVDFLFKKFHGYAYYAVLGFLAASMVIVFPGIRTGWNLMLDVACFVLSTALSFALMNLKSLNFFSKNTKNTDSD